jgi:hypothetical protein
MAYFDRAINCTARLARTVQITYDQHNSAINNRFRTLAWACSGEKVKQICKYICSCVTEKFLPWNVE